MKLTKLILENFRGYKEKIMIDFSDFTTFVGKNDSGKSTILEALDIFFNDNKGVARLDESDINVENGESGKCDVIIGACFTNLPDTVILDSTHETTLQNEFLLNDRKELEIIKRYPKAGKAKVFIAAMHPSNSQCDHLLEMKNSELKKILDLLNIESIDRTKNAEMRTAIWNYYKNDLKLERQCLEVNKGDVKNIWDSLNTYLPMYSLFQSDRSNSDKDEEIQDPLKYAVRELMATKDIQDELVHISEQVIQKLNEVANRTLDKLRDMDPDVAATLKPVIPSAKDLKWADVFKNVAISSDNGIAINKRGSGVRRLILLNFFRAEAERRLEEHKLQNNTAEVIYAIEEPETSQHFKNQLILIQALKELACNNSVQIILTTHSGIILKQLSFNDIRLVDKGNVEHVKQNCLPYPSLNEINYIAFDQNTEEYHDELYAFLKSDRELFNLFEQEQCKVRYIQRFENSEKVKIKEISLTQKIRHQIHHPENRENEKYTYQELEQSIDNMRMFINTHSNEFHDNEILEE